MSADKKITAKFIAGWMRVISSKAHHTFTRKLAASEVTVAEWIILRMIHESGPTVSSSDIAAQTGLSRGAVSKLVERARKKGLVSRTESKTDRRYQEIKLTAKAKRLFPKLAKFGQETDDEYFSCLTSTERKTFVRLLKKIAKENQITKIPID